MMGLTDFFNAARLARMALLGVLGITAIYVEAAPLGIGPTVRPSPDLLLCVVCYWAARRPGSTPMIAVFALGLVRDLLTDVPVGAGALALVLVAEVVKAWRHHLARAPFFVEWLAVGAAAFAAAALPWLIVLLTLAQPPYLVSLGHQIVYTAMIYPFIALVLRWMLRISWRKPEPA